MAESGTYGHASPPELQRTWYDATDAAEGRRRSLLALCPAERAVEWHPATHTEPSRRPPDEQIVTTAAGSVRVTSIKGFVYPWALAFLPNGDMLVTEQGRNTLRIVRGGVLDPTPITGLPTGITSTRRDTAGVDIAVHPRFAENRFIYVALLEAAGRRRQRQDRGAGSRAVRRRQRACRRPRDFRIGLVDRRAVRGSSRLRPRRQDLPGDWRARVRQRAGRHVVGTGSGRARRQDSAIERRWQHAFRQSFRRTPRIPARDLRARHPQRDRADRTSRHRRTLGNRERSPGW